MWIESAWLEGYKSFKKRVEIKFNKRHTLIIGHNGAGKSNLLSALAVILAGNFISRDERRLVINPNGNGAKVEVIFNNESRRLPISNDRVIIQRCLVSKSDTFKVNGVMCSRQEVITMLETAGISLDNPYNIVKTSDVVTICNSSNADRLRIVRDFAGQGNFTTRQAENQRTLAAVDEDTNEVTAMLQNLNVHLDELQEDCQNIDKYNRADAEARTLSFVLVERQIEALTEKLKAAEDLLRDSNEIMAPKRQILARAEKASESASEALNDVCNMRESLESNKAQIIENLNELDSR